MEFLVLLNAFKTLKKTLHRDMKLLDIPDVSLQREQNE